MRLQCRVADHQLTLEPLRPGDARRLFGLIEAGRARLRQHLPWVDRTTRTEDVEAFLQDPAVAGQPVRHLGIRADGALVGVIGLNRLDLAGRTASIGYWIDEAFEGRGLVTAACRLLIAHASATLGVRRFELRITPGNERSLAVARRLGFRFERILPADGGADGAVHEVHVLPVAAPAARA